MAYSVAIAKTPAGKPYAHLSFADETVFEHLVGAFQDVVRLDGFHSAIDSCWDFSNASLDVSYLELQQLASHFIGQGAGREGHPFCALVSHTPNDVSILETYIPVAARYPVVFQIHSSLAEALEWLDTH